MGTLEVIGWTYRRGRYICILEHDLLSNAKKYGLNVNLLLGQKGFLVCKKFLNWQLGLWISAC